MNINRTLYLMAKRDAELLTEKQQVVPVQNGKETQYKIDTNDLMERMITDLELTSEQAAGIIGNLTAESGLYAGRLQGKGVQIASSLEPNRAIGHGLAQWTHSSRKEKLRSFAATQYPQFETIKDKDGKETHTALDLTNPTHFAKMGSAEMAKMEYGFLKHELTTEPEYVNMMKKIKKDKMNADQTSRYFMKTFERPADQGEPAQLGRSTTSTEIHTGFTKFITDRDAQRALSTSAKAPAVSPTSPVAAPTKDLPIAPTPDQDHDDYDIAGGDTLSQIAKNKNTTVDELQKRNPEIKDINKIRVGQRIKLPKQPVAPVTTPVKESIEYFKERVRRFLNDSLLG